MSYDCEVLVRMGTSDEVDAFDKWQDIFPFHPGLESVVAISGVQPLQVNYTEEDGDSVVASVFACRDWKDADMVNFAEYLLMVFPKLSFIDCNIISPNICLRYSYENGRVVKNELTDDEFNSCSCDDERCDLLTATEKDADKREVVVATI